MVTEVVGLIEVVGDPPPDAVDVGVEPPTELELEPPVLEPSLTVTLEHVSQLLIQVFGLRRGMKASMALGFKTAVMHRHEMRITWEFHLLCDDPELSYPSVETIW